MLGFPLDSLRVTFHRHNLTASSKEEQGIEFKVKELILHPEFSYYTLRNDVAIWRLEPIVKPFFNSSQLTTVRLDNGKNSFPGRNVTVLGWGATSETGKASDVLMELTVPVVNHTVCEEVLGPRVDKGMLCAGGEEGKDACAGDSGGPLAVMRFFERPVLVGVVSWGRGKCYNSQACVY